MPVLDTSSYKQLALATAHDRGYISENLDSTLKIVGKSTFFGRITTFFKKPEAGSYQRQALLGELGQEYGKAFQNKIKDLAMAKPEKPLSVREVKTYFRQGEEMKARLEDANRLAAGGDYSKLNEMYVESLTRTITGDKSDQFVNLDGLGKAWEAAGLKKHQDQITDCFTRLSGNGNPVLAGFYELEEGMSENDLRARISLKFLSAANKHDFNKLLLDDLKSFRTDDRFKEAPITRTDYRNGMDLLNYSLHLFKETRTFEKHAELMDLCDDFKSSSRSPDDELKATAKIMILNGDLTTGGQVLDFLRDRLGTL